MKDRNKARVRTGASADEGITLGPYMKGIWGVFAIGFVLFTGIEVAGILREAAAGHLRPMIPSNLYIVGLAVYGASFLLLLLACGANCLIIANTTFSSWGIERPDWPGVVSVPWSAVTLITPARRGLQFHAKGKVLVFPFRMFDSVPEELLDLISEHAPKSAAVGLYPGFNFSDPD